VVFDEQQITILRPYQNLYNLFPLYIAMKKSKKLLEIYEELDALKQEQYKGYSAHIYYFKSLEKASKALSADLTERIKRYEQATASLTGYKPPKTTTAGEKRELADAVMAIRRRYTLAFELCRKYGKRLVKDIDKFGEKMDTISEGAAALRSIISYDLEHEQKSVIPALNKAQEIIYKAHDKYFQTVRDSFDRLRDSDQTLDNWLEKHDLLDAYKDVKEEVKLDNGDDPMFS